MYAGILTKFVQNGAKYGQRRQVDVAGGLGPTWPCWPAPPRHCLEPHLPLPHHRSVGEVLQAFSTTDLKSVCTKGQDGVALDPWAHCHRLGALQPTLEPPYLPNFDMCWLHNRLLEPSITVGSRGGGFKGRPTPLSTARCPSFLHQPS